MAGMFGNDDALLAQERAQGLQLAQGVGELGYGAALGMPTNARIVSEGLMTGLGLDNPRMKQQKALESVYSEIDPNDPASMMRAAQKLLQLGMTTEAQQLVKAAQDAQMHTAKIGSEGALAYQRQASGMKDLAYEDVEDRKMNLKAQTDITTTSMGLKQRDAIDRARLKLEEIKAQAQAEGDYAQVRLAEARIKDLEAKRDIELLKESQVDTTKFVPKTLEVIAPYAKAIKPTASIVSTGNEVLDILGLDEKQTARFLQQPAEFAKTWLSNENNVTRLKNAKVKFSNAQVVKLLGELSGSSSNEELKRFSEGLNNGYTNDEVFLKDMVMALESAKSELDHYQGITEFAEQNGNNPLKVQNEIARREKARLERTVKRAEKGSPKPIGKANLPDGVYDMNGRQVTVKGGVAYE